MTIGLVIAPQDVRNGGRSDVPPGTGLSGEVGSRPNEIHTLVPGSESANPGLPPDFVGAWVDARTGLLRFDRLPDNSNFVGRYTNLNGGQFNAYAAPNSIATLPITTPVLIAPTAPAPPPLELPPAPRWNRSVINLATLIEISTYNVDRQYVKGTLKSIDREIVKITNKSKQVDINVSLLGIAGVSFEPSSFELPKDSTIDVNVIFDSVAIDQYPEGISTVNCVLNLTSNTAVLDALPPAPPRVRPAEEDEIIPPTPEADAGWVERRFNFSALQPTLGRLQDISPGFLNSITTPELTRTVPSINYSTMLPPNYGLSWTRTLQLKENTRYKFTISTDEGVRVFSFGRMLLDEWSNQQSRTFTFNADANSIGLLSMYIEYRNNIDFGSINVRWEELNVENSGGTVQPILPTLPTLPTTSPTVSPPPPSTSPVWINGLDGSVNPGLPPAGWVAGQDGAWYPSESQPNSGTTDEITRTTSFPIIPTQGPPPPRAPITFTSEPIVRFQDEVDRFGSPSFDLF